MKTLFLLLIGLSLSLATFAQSEPLTGDSLLFSNFFEAVKVVFNYVNWVFVLVFIVISWLTNDTADATNTTRLNWFAKFPKVLRVLFLGILQILLFAWVFKLTSPLDYFKFIISILFSMVAYKIGINKLFKAISESIFRFKFE